MQQKSDNVVSHYVFEAPVRIWHWLTVLCMAVLMVTGYFIGKPLPSVSGEATYLFYTVKWIGLFSPIWIGPMNSVSGSMACSS